MENGEKCGIMKTFNFFYSRGDSLANNLLKYSRIYV